MCIRDRLVEAVHLRQMCHRDAALRREVSANRAGGIALHDVHGIACHVDGNVTYPLLRLLAWRHDVHREVTDAAVLRELDLGTTLPHTREPVDFVARHAVALARHGFHGNRVAAEARDEPIAFGRPAGTTRPEREAGEKEESFHATTFEGHVLRRKGVGTVSYTHLRAHETP